MPQAGRNGKGTPIVNRIKVQPGDKIHAVVPVREFSESSFLVFATNLGVVKRTPLVDFSRPRQAGIRAISLIEGEHLVSVRETDGTRDILMATSDGMAIRFHETDSRSMGRTARGVRGIRVRDGQQVIGMVVIDPEKQEDTLLAVTENGYGKRTPLSSYRVQRRGGTGLITIKCSERNGALLAVRDVTGGEQLMVITRGGIMIRIGIDNISEQSRNTQGVRIINLKGDDRVGSIAKISQGEITPDDDESTTDAETGPIDSED